jgi:transposase
VLAGLARGRMKAKRAALIEALTGRVDAHHAELTRTLLDQIDQLNAQIGLWGSRTRPWGLISGFRLRSRTR